MQSRQRFQIRLGQQVRSACQHLAELHICRPHGFKVIRQLIRRGLAIDLWLQLFGIDLVIVAHVLHQIGPSVFPKDLGDFFIAFEMIGREFHVQNKTG